MIRPRFLSLILAVGLSWVGGVFAQDSAPVRVAQATSSGVADSSDDDDGYTGVQFRMPGADGTLSAPSPTTPETPGDQVIDSTAAGVAADAVQGEKPKFTPAEIVEFYPPFYPLPLRMEGIEGRIDLLLTIGIDGKVMAVDVITATAPQFREYAVEAAKEWTFIPAKVDGQPVPVRVTFPVPFISEFGSGQLFPNSPLARLIYLDGTYYWIGDDGKRSRANLNVTPILRLSPAYAPPEDQTGPLRVELSFTVNEVGRVVNPSVVESSNTAFDQAALRAIRYWQFIPRIKNGRPVASRVRLPMIFGSGGNDSN